MQKFIALLLALTTGSPAFSKGYITDKDVKTLSQITALGGTAANLINTDKIYDLTNTQQLSLSIANGALGGGSSSGGGAGVNYLSDPNGQKYPTGAYWTVATGTGAADTVNYTDGTQSIKVTASSQQSKLSQDVTPTTQLTNQNIQATAWVKTALTNVQVCARVAGVATNCQPVSSANVWAPYTATMIGPASGSIGIEVSMTSSGTGTFNVQLGYVGKATNTAMVAPTLQDWVDSGASTLTAVTTSPTKGTIVSDSVKWRRVGDSMELTWNYEQSTAGTGGSGTYLIAIPGSYAIDTTKQPVSGSSLKTIVGFGQGSNAASSFNTTSVDLEVQAYDSTHLAMTMLIDTSSRHAVDQSNFPLSNTIQKYSIHAKFPISGWSGSSQQTGFRADATPASWSGSQTVSGGWNTTSGGFADLSAGTSIVTTQATARNISCSSFGTNAGITCTLPRAGIYHICAIAISFDNSASIMSDRLVDSSGTIINGGVDAGINGSRWTAPLCGEYSASAAGSFSFKIQSAVSAGTGQLLNTNGGGPAITWSIVELDAPMPAPFLTGSVTSNTSNQLRIETAQISAAGSVTAQSSPWISSISNPSTGRYTITLAAGAFSSAPTCSITNANGSAGGGSNGGDTAHLEGNPTTSTIWFFISNGGSGAAEQSHIICVGPR